MSAAALILCIIVIFLWLILALLWIARTVIDFIDERETRKRSRQWDAERRQLEKERAIREVEYHEARMKELR